MSKRYTMTELTAHCEKELTTHSNRADNIQITQPTTHSDRELTAHSEKELTTHNDRADHRQ